MDTAAAPTCARHPRVETRVSCVQCGAHICPDCMVSAPVGFKCPDCAKQARHARGLGRPEQYVRGAGFGLGAAIAGAAILSVVFGFGFLSWIASGVVGYYVAEAVRRGAGGNRADPFRTLAIGLAVLAVAGGWLVWAGFDPGRAARALGNSPFALVTFAAAIYGAFRSAG